MAQNAFLSIFKWNEPVFLASPDFQEFLLNSVSVCGAYFFEDYKNFNSSNSYLLLHCDELERIIRVSLAPSAQIFVSCNAQNSQN